MVAASWWDCTPLDIRERIHQRIMEIEAPIYPVWSIEDHLIQNQDRFTPLRIYLPREKEHLPMILLIHGGAWVAGNLDTHDLLARYLCSQVEAIVVSVGYTNAPEAKFPCQLLQCQDTLSWVIDHADEFSADASKIAVVGDSAGGNMAAALCLMVRDQHGPKLTLQVLLNPALDLRCNGTLERQHDSLDNLRWQVNHYLSKDDDSNHPYVSPLCAEHLEHLPAAVILVAEKDELRPDGEMYAQRLKEAGVPTVLYCQQGIGHLAGHGARASSQAKESIDVAVKAFKRAFEK